MPDAEIRVAVLDLGSGWTRALPDIVDRKLLVGPEISSQQTVQQRSTQDCPDGAPLAFYTWRAGAEASGRSDL